MNAALIVPLLELKSHATGMRRVLNPTFFMESISALVGGVYPQKESKVFPRLTPGLGKTGAADPTEDKDRHAMVTMKHFNLFTFSSIRIFIDMGWHGDSARTHIKGTRDSHAEDLVYVLGAAR